MKFDRRLAGIYAILVAGILAQAAECQLRIVDYNTAGVPNPSSMTTVVSAMNGHSVNGVIKPIDVVILQELSGGDLIDMLSILNSQGVGTYAAGDVGSTTGAGSVGLIYRTQTVDLISDVQVVDTSSNGAARGVMRYQLRPDGYGPEADFYIYNSHYKASNSSSDRARRNIEAAAIRANADALGQRTHIIYAGDFNIYNSAEPMWATLTDSGNGQAFDPVNQIGNWHDGGNFLGVHTQNPAGSGFVGGGMDDRFDWQMVTSELMDNEGMSILDGSYQAFGNNATHALNGHINSGNGASMAVLNALGSASDHLPVIAQYQLPAKMNVVVSHLLSQVLVSSPVSTTVRVINSAGDGVSIVSPVGADELKYTIIATGDAVGSVNGSDFAFGGGNMHSFDIDTATAGHKSATFSTTATSPQVPNPTSMVTREYIVLDHATPSFSSQTLETTLVHDFGTVEMGEEAADFDFSIFNLEATTGFTADLDFDLMFVSGNVSILTTDLAKLAGITLVAGTGQSFSAEMSTATVGSFSATYSLRFSDQDLPGELTKNVF